MVIVAFVYPVAPVIRMCAMKETTGCWRKQNKKEKHNQSAWHSHFALIIMIIVIIIIIIILIINIVIIIVIIVIIVVIASLSQSCHWLRS